MEGTSQNNGTNIPDHDSKENIQFLETYFDKKIKDLKQKHPISKYLINIAPWRIKWLDQFIEIIKQIQNNNNNNSLLKSKLSDVNKFREGLIFLYNYKCFRDRNCRTDFILEDNENKIVDLKITDLTKGYDMFIECTEVKDTAEENDAHNTYSVISKKVNEEVKKHDLYYIGKILLEYISQPSDLLRDISMHANTASKNGYSELIDGSIIIAFCKNEQLDLLKKFSEEHNIQFDPSSLQYGKIFMTSSSIIGTKPTTVMRNVGNNPTFNNQFRGFLLGQVLHPMPIHNRIATKIECKRKQIKKTKINKNNSTNSLFIENLVFFNSYLDNNSKFIEQHIKKQHSIDLLIIYSGHIGGRKDNYHRKINKNIVNIYQSVDHISREIIIIKNENSVNLNNTNYFFELLQMVYLNNTLLH